MQHWSYGSAHFACQISGNSWEGWFPANAIVDIKPVLDSHVRYIDVGGAVFGSLSRDCSFPDAHSRDAFLDMLGTTATLNNGAGRSRSAVLTQAQYINADGPYYIARATWEAL